VSLLTARAATAGYGHFPAVTGVYLDVEAGRCLAVLGPNGAGKSTLLRALAGVLPLSAGTILLEGRPLAQWQRREVAKRVTLVPQSVQFTFPVSVEEVVAQGRAPHLGPWRSATAADRAAVQRALEAVGLADKAQISIHQLSGGERQRVILARALATEARVLLLDEPATALDLHHQAELASVVRQRLKAGVAVVLVAHDLNFALALADEVLVLQRGAVVAHGSPSQVVSPQLLRCVFHVEGEFLTRGEGATAVLPRLG
jgi:iron complex transport system ATP-binding protein